MAKIWTYVGLLGIALGLNGCGGSSQGVGGDASNGGLALASYRATLADGTAMVIDFVSETSGFYSGSFALAPAGQGEVANQSGSFLGTLSGDQLSAECTAVDGKTFQLVGPVSGAQGLRLTRSDAPGQPLTFSRIPSSTPSRTEISFYLDGLSGSKGRVALNATPNSVTTAGSTTIREYKGTWLGVPVVFWSYNTGAANLVVYNDPLCVTSAMYTSYLPSDFPTKTMTASSGYMTMYNSSIRAQLKFKTLPVVSPG